MPRTPAKVTQADIARVLRALKQVGGDWRVDVRPDGTIRAERSDIAEEVKAAQYKGEIKLW
jgi:hypothetical protein